MGLWQLRSHLGIHKDQLLLMGGMLGMTASMNRTSSVLELAITVVNEVKGVTRATQAALLMPNSGGVMKLTAMSDVEHLDGQSHSALLTEKIVAGLPETLIHWNRGDPSSRLAGIGLPAKDLDAWCELFRAEAVVFLPLKNRSEQVIAWAVAGFADKGVLLRSFLKQLENIAALAGGQFDVIMRNHRSPGRVALENGRRWLGERWVKVAAGTLGLAALLMVVPFKYSVPCDCQVQLVNRRFVAAPYEGLLEKTLVESGDVVTAGQVLARMDARQLRMELSSMTAELDSQRKRRDSALARGNVAESQIAASEMSRLESKVNILQTRLENTEIRSPLAGIVVSGDLEKAEGVPMEMGQNLFEVGPLHKMLVEVRIPEYEIRMVSAGMPVQFEFDAFPFRTFDGTLQRIHPRAESLESKSVFVGEIQIDNSDGLLRPGLKGRARIRGDRYPLGWNLFHHAWDSARRWLVW
jgi:biotin carboxyl carrier protein